MNWKEDGEVFLVNYYDDDKDERECSVSLRRIDEKRK